MREALCFSPDAYVTAVGTVNGTTWSQTQLMYLSFLERSLRCARLPPL